LNLCLPIVLAILFGDLFSAMATLLAVCGLAKLTDENGDLPKLQQALTADATAAMGAALLGTNTPVIYIESAAGVEQGGRTGLVSIVVAACYIAALFFTPVIAAVPTMATGPVLVVIGIFMAQGLGELKFEELTIAATFLVTMLLMVLTSASDGLALGLITCVLMHLLTRRAKEIKPAAYALAGLFLLHYLFP
jgi:AGZA family xanthine/uracil permease-like MFS transporter